MSCEASPGIFADAHAFMLPSAVRCQFDAASQAELISTIGCWFFVGSIALAVSAFTFDRFLNAYDELKAGRWGWLGAPTAIVGVIASTLALLFANWPWQFPL